MEEARKRVQVGRIAMRWGEMDAMGRVNSTVHFRHMEQARIGCFEKLSPDGAAVLAFVDTQKPKPVRMPQPTMELLQ